MTGGLPAQLLDLLASVQAGEVDPQHGLERLARLPFDDLGFARVDLHRELRQGAPEAVLAEGKSPAEVAAIVTALIGGDAASVMVTRADEAARTAVRDVAPDACEHARARVAWVARSVPSAVGRVTIVSGGTSDGPAVHEARIRAELLGTTVVVHEDVGVAGLHRLAPALEDLREADCVIVAAGQDAALTSVVGGLVAAPVIGVPTSTGYGTALGGLTALFAMLASCAAGVSVVNIDDGFGAGTIAARIARAAGRPGRHDAGSLRRRDRRRRRGHAAGGADRRGRRCRRAGGRAPRVGRGALSLRTERVDRGGIACCHATIVSEEAPARERRLRDIRELIDGAGLESRVADRSHAVFAALATAEGAVHGISPEEVHFHEVGALDAIGDVCGIALALELLAIDQLCCSPLPVPRGFVASAHGQLPLPAPATLELLRGAPLHGVDLDAELVTPTGAAVLAGLSASPYGALPSMVRS